MRRLAERVHNNLRAPQSVLDIPGGRDVLVDAERATFYNPDGPVGLNLGS